MLGKFFQSKFFTFSALLAIFLLAVSLLRIQPQRIAVERKIKNFQEKIRELERSNSQLGNLLDYFKSDAFLEKEAKLKLNVKRPDEEVVFLHEADVNPVVNVSSEDSKFSRIKNYWANLRQWLDQLFK